MTAKEMFERLEYHQEEDNYYIRFKEINDKNVKYEIVFCKENETIELMPKINGKDHYFTRVDMDLLQAINKQVEELGWYD